MYKEMTTSSSTPSFQLGKVGVLQKTLNKPISCVGRGVHSGERVQLRLLPALPNTGIIFKRVDLDISIPGIWAGVISTQLCTTLGHPSGAKIATIEHLMAALNALGVDNLIVEVGGAEIPVMDGSSEMFVDLIDQAGLQEQDAPRRAIIVKRSLQVGSADRWVSLEPSVDRSFTFSCIFDRPIPFPDQHFTFILTPESFREDISKARTFGFMEDLELLKAKGLAQGASLSNAVGLSASGVLNPEGLRYKDECVRHKILDAVGDLALAGLPIIGAFTGYRSGHELNYQLVKSLMEDTSAYVIASLDSIPQIHLPFGSAH